MPLYEYECQECGHRFEMLQKVADSPLKVCVKCKGKVERLLSSPAIQFKGSGWYITDYARKGESSSTQTSETSGASSEKSSKESSGSPSKAAKPEKNRSKSGPAASASSTSKD